MHRHQGTSQNGDPTQMTEPQADSARSTMTPEEKRWILYDVGNSAFVLLSTAIIPIYANSLLKQAGESNIVSTWGYAQTAAALVIALLMPLLGSIADIQGMKIKFFLGFCGTGMLACCALALPLSLAAFSYPLHHILDRIERFSHLL
jgi:UMF1 family MFS transporter